MYIYCIAGVCATLEIHQEKFFGSMQDMYLVTRDINEAVLGLLSEEIMQKYLFQKTILRILSVKTFSSSLFLCQYLVMVAKFCIKH